MILPWWHVVLTDLVECTAPLFVGMWLKDDSSLKRTLSINEYTSLNSQAASAAQKESNVIGGADKLKLYKELLDSGAITQEEFDQQKKKIIEQELL